MPFDNFYEESDKAARRWWKCIGAAIFLFVGYWSFALLSLPTTEVDKKPDEAALSLQRLRRVKALCEYVPKPEQFDLIADSLPEHNVSSTIVVYKYRSERNFDEVMPFFSVWFGSNGWQRLNDKPSDHNLYAADREVVFFKNNQTISIIYYDLRTRPDYSLDLENYVIQCQENVIVVVD